MLELTHINNTTPSNIDQLVKLSGELVELESTLSSFWLLSPTMKVIAENGAWVKVNPACKEYLGCDEADLLGNGHKKFIHPEDYAISDNANWILKDESIVTRFKNRYFNKTTKQWVILEWYAHRDPYSGTIFATALDKTLETQQKEQLLHLAEQNQQEKSRFKKALDLCATGIFLTGDDRLCTYVNSAYCELTGFKLDDVLGGGWENVLCHWDKERIPEEWRAYTKLAKDSPAPVPFETTACFIHKETNRELNVKIYAYFYDTDAIIGYVTPVY